MADSEGSQGALTMHQALPVEENLGTGRTRVGAHSNKGLL